GDGVLLRLQVGLGFLAGGMLLAAGLVPLVAWPGTKPPFAGQLATAAGWVALALVFLAGAWRAWALEGGRLLGLGAAAGLGGGGGLAAGVLLACAAAGAEAPWLDYHLLTLAWSLTAAGVLATGWWLAVRSSAHLRPASPFLRWTTGLGVLVLALGVRAMA